MEPYEGTNPYLFISYAHLDNDHVNTCINFLQQNQCYLWYDKGNHAGDDWAENIANHLVKSECVLLFISKNSIKSVNVNNELIMALNYKKHVIPIVIDDVELPLGWQIKIGHLHIVRMTELSKEELNKLLKEIPADVFNKVSSPFYKNDRHSFYINSEEVKRDYEKKLNIYCETNGVRKLIWTHMFSSTPHKVVPLRGVVDSDRIIKVNIICQVTDDFFDMKNNGCVIFSIRVGLLLPYPLFGPDGDGIMIFAIINPRGETPRVVLLDSMTSHDGTDSTPAYEYDPLVPCNDRIDHSLPKFECKSNGFPADKE